MLRGPLRTWSPDSEGWVEILGRRSRDVIAVAVVVVVVAGVERVGRMEGRREGRVRKVLWRVWEVRLGWKEGVEGGGGVGLRAFVMR